MREKLQIDGILPNQLLETIGIKEVSLELGTA